MGLSAKYASTQISVHGLSSSRFFGSLCKHHITVNNETEVLRPTKKYLLYPLDQEPSIKFETAFTYTVCTLSQRLLCGFFLAKHLF